MNTQNGWPVLDGGSQDLYEWVIPARGGHFSLRLRRGAAGFILAVWALWFSETVQRVLGPVLDDWAWAVAKAIPGTTEFSNHASGTAVDLNATAHPWGKAGTFTAVQVAAIHAKLRRFHGVIRWGGDYMHKVDEMHWEINAPYAQTLREARAKRFTPRGIRVLRANPSQRGHLYK